MSPVETERATVTWTLEDELATVRFDDGKVNTLTIESIAALRATLADAAHRARAIVLAGRPGALSAGLDLRVVRRGDASALDQLMGAAERLYHDMLALPVPLVTACTGHALAGGALLLLCSDHRVGLSSLYGVGLVEVSIGVAMPVLGSTLAARRLDRRFLHRAVVLGERFTPAQAVEVGYLDELAADPEEIATQRARALAGLDPPAFLETKMRVAQIAAPLPDAVSES